MTDGRPATITRVHAVPELVADGCVHVVGVIAGLVGAVALVALAAGLVGAIEMGSVVIYSCGLLAMLGFSATYNMVPPSRIKWLLRRADHSAIYVMIAGTYTPFMTQMKDTALAAGLSATVWLGALAGVALKLSLPGRYDRAAIAIYLALGWSVVIVIEPLAESLPQAALWLLTCGGILYSAGVVFHVWESLPFQNAIWHSFVLAAASCHYVAILDCMVLSRA